MKKVLFITSSFPKSENSHEGGFILELARKIPQNKFSVTILAPHFPYGKIREAWPLVTIYRFVYFFPMRFERLAYGPGLLFNIRNSFFAKAGVVPFCIAEFLSALLIVSRERSQIVHSHWLLPQGLIGGLLNLVLKIPHVATIHGSDLNLIKKFRIFYPLCSFIVHYSDAITVNSNYMKKQLEAIVPESKQKIRVIPMGIEPEKYQNIVFSDLISTNKTNHIILSVGRLIDIKGIIFLIEAMPVILRKYSDSKLIIIGDGPDRKSLENRCRELEISDAVKFLGMKNPEDLPIFYHSADVFVLPSINIGGSTEALGVVLLEAMAAGCPVIGSNVGGIPDIITDGKNGFLVPEKNSDALAEGIIKIISDTSLQEIFRKNGYLKIHESFNWDKIANDFSQLFDLVLESHKKMERS